MWKGQPKSVLKVVPQRCVLLSVKNQEEKMPLAPGRVAIGASSSLGASPWEVQGEVSPPSLRDGSSILAVLGQ